MSQDEGQEPTSKQAIARTSSLFARLPRWIGRRHLNLKWPALAVCGLIAVVILIALHPEDKTWKQVQQSGVLRFEMDASFPPFDGLTETGEFVGLDVDLARELAHRLGLRAEIAAVGADGLYDALRVRRCDVIISALTPDPQRARDFRYTAPYFDAGLVLVVPVTSTINSDLRGQRLAVELGSEGDSRARWLARRTVGLRVLTYDTPTEAMQAVEMGQADAALTDTAMARQYVAAHPTLHIGPRQTSSPYVIAVRADAPELWRRLDRALEQIKADGTLERIIERWLDR